MRAVYTLRRAAEPEPPRGETRAAAARNRTRRRGVLTGPSRARYRNRHATPSEEPRMRTPRARTALLPTLVTLAALAALGVAGCGGGDTGGESDEPEASGPAYDGPMVDPEVAVITVEGMGEIVIELLPGKAPRTVENFKKLVREGFYDGTTFHRVVPGFMIQGGDPNTKDRDPRNDGRGGPGYTIPGEFSDLKHERGTVSMARRGSPDSGGSQFFIIVDDAPHLDGQYAAFGHVVSGIEVADQVVAVPRDKFGRHGPRDRPLEDVHMTIRLEPAAGTGGEEAGGQAVEAEPHAAEPATEPAS
jgi:peptidyl-prolyl cis-trans isomerase B (cyclophilin B)